MKSSRTQSARTLRTIPPSVLLQMALERELYAQRVGERISALRSRDGIGQEDAARKLGVSYRAYQAWERGEHVPYPRNLQRIAEFFGVAVEDITGNGTTTPATYAAELLGALPAHLERIESKLDTLLRLVEDSSARLSRAEDRITQLGEEALDRTHADHAASESERSPVEPVERPVRRGVRRPR